MERLFQLRDKVETLLRRYASLQSENAALRKAVSEKDEEIASLREKFAKAEMRVLATQISQAFPENEARGVARRQLDEAIGGIDKILATLP